MTTELWIGIVGAGVAPMIRASAAMRHVVAASSYVTLYRIGRGGGLVLPALPADEIGAVILRSSPGRSAGLDDVVTHLFETWEYTGSTPATTRATVFASSAEKTLVTAVLRRLGIRWIDARLEARDIVEAALRNGVATYLAP